MKKIKITDNDLIKQIKDKTEKIVACRNSQVSMGLQADRLNAHMWKAISEQIKEASTHECSLDQETMEVLVLYPKN